MEEECGKCKTGIHTSLHSEGIFSFSVHPPPLSHLKPFSSARKKKKKVVICFSKREYLYVRIYFLK